jgi:hypothetical protein
MKSSRATTWASTDYQHIAETNLLAHSQRLYGAALETNGL